MQTHCPDQTVWQTFHDGSMSEADRVLVESHLVRCAACRQRLITVFDAANEAELDEATPMSLRRRAVETAAAHSGSKSFIYLVRPYAPLALAATILLVVGISWLAFRQKTPVQPPSELRQSNRIAGAIPLTSPLNGSELAAGKIGFSWGDAGPGARYEFILTDEKGDIVFQEKPTTNALTFDTAALRLSTQRKYYWSVTAKMADGTRRESAVAGFALK